MFLKLKNEFHNLDPFFKQFFSIFFLQMFAAWLYVADLFKQ